MRDTLPPQPKSYEKGIMNLSKQSERGSHWCAWVKVKNLVIYYDSFAVPPPPEFYRYMRGEKILYNTIEDQKLGEDTCGHWCIKFLQTIDKYQ